MERLERADMKNALQDAAPDIPSSAVSLKVHQWRSALYEELHNRPSPVIDGPCQVSHFTVLLDNNREELYSHSIETARNAI